MPGKNIRLLGGKPLVAWTVELALKVPAIDQLVISSDDPAIIEAAQVAGCKMAIVRPKELARDDAPSESVVMHALEVLVEPFDLVVLLQPTSPFRSIADLEGALAAFVESGAPSCISVTEPDQSPFWMYQMDERCHLSRLISPPSVVDRRQDLPPVYAANGAIYIADVDWFRENRTFIGKGSIGFFMPKDRSIDIDTLLDFRLAELLVADQSRT